MGYYSSVHIEEEQGTKVEPFEVTYKTKGFDGNEVDWYGFENAQVLEDGTVYVDDNYAKFYDAEEFAKLLATKMKHGRINLMFTGEDGGRYGYIVEPNAVVEYNDIDDYVYSYLEKGDELYEKLLKEKIERYKKEIENMKQKIEILKKEAA